MVVPDNVPNGDLVLSAAFGGSTTQSNLLITVQQ
jgi:hypothetical protein